MRKLCAVVVVVLAATLLTSEGAVAFHDPPESVLSTVTLPGGGWAAFTFVVPEGGSVVHYEEMADFQGAEAAADGLWISKDGEDYSGGTGLCRTGSPRVHVEFGPAGVLVDSGEDHSGGGGCGVATSWQHEPGTYTAVFAQSFFGDGESTFTIYAGDGVELLGATSGTDAFAHREPDFRGTANVHATARLAGARAIVDASVSETAESRMYSSFVNFAIFAPAPASLTVDGPGGSQTGDFWLDTEGGPGSYTYTIDYALGGGVVFEPVIWLVGADVTLPEV